MTKPTSAAEPILRACSTCAHAGASVASPVSSGARGVACRRYPPQVDIGTFARWPVVAPSDRCGEWTAA